MTFNWPKWWEHPTTLSSLKSIPTAVVSATETLLDVNARNTWLNELSHKLTGKPISEIEHLLREFFFILLLISVPIAFFKAYQRKHHLAAKSDHQRNEDAVISNLWQTSRWPVLFGLCDLHILGILPFGPWKDEVERGFKIWPEKRYLRRLIHMGILPLYIQNGGLETRQEKELNFSDGFPYAPTMPQYVQGKRRAYFEFLVPKARGFSDGRREYDPRDEPFRQFVRRLLSNHHGYRVCVSGDLKDGQVNCSDPPPDPNQPLEVGARSFFELLLPFKRDREIQTGKGTDWQKLADFLKPNSCPLLEQSKCPLMRIEVSHYGPRRLDQWVFGVAQECGLGRVWKEAALHAHVSEWILENGLRLPEYLVPVRDRV